MRLNCVFGMIILLSVIGAQGLFGQIEMPRPANPDAVVRHDFYSLEYSEDVELARWVAYELTDSEVHGRTPRKDDFRMDPRVRTGSAGEREYYKSGFDRGHLAPAGDMKISEEAMSQSFYMSNITPQRPYFNRGIWLRLEKMVRTWAVQNGAVLVVTGPILDQSEYQRIGTSGIAVPERFYKVILDYRQPEIKAIGFILPNRKSDQPVRNFAMTVDQVELETGIDFFYQLPDEIENSLESSLDTDLWPFVEFRYR